MRRGAKPAKAKNEAEPLIARKARKSGGSRVHDLEKHLAEAQRREAEAHEQQTATAEILRVISGSPSDVQPVFDAIVRSAVRLCDGVFSIVLRFDGERIHLGAQHNFSPDALAAFRRWFPRRAADDRLVGRALLEQRVMNVPDVTSEFRFVPGQQEQGFRSALFVPMVRDGVSIGVIGVSRMAVGPFPENQVDLLQTFANQAVIAIENVRLFTDLQARNRDLTETLEQQTATSEILRVISSSPTDVQPVFEAIAESAVRLMGAAAASVYEFDGALVHLRVLTPNTWPYAEDLRQLYPRAPGRDLAAGRVILERAVLHVADLQTDPATPSVTRRVAGRMGLKSVLWVPMLRKGAPLGVIGVVRATAGFFSDEQVRLLRTFADQAVIAIENVRLFTELEARNRDLTDALEQQTATSEVLRTIAQAQSDVQPVFDTIVRSAARLCHAVMASVLLTDGRMLYLPANYGSSPEALSAVRARFPRPLDTETVSGAAILTRSVVHVPDIQEPSVIEFTRQAGQVLGYRSLVTVPMLREGEVVGAINVCRREPGRFSDAEVALLKTFADQAVIAVENVRLFKELRSQTAALTRSVQQLTALGEVGHAVSSTLDLATVLTTIVARAVELSGLDGGEVFEYDEGTEEFTQRAAAETGGVLAQARRGTRYRKGEGVLGRTAVTLEPAQVPDITVPGAYDSRVRQNLIESGVRAILAVPMIHQGRLIGCLGVTRNRPGDFPAETIELLRTFATQSALAIQNARLFREIEDKSRQLEAASQHKSEFLANMSHELRTPLNAIIGFSEILAEKMFGDINEKQTEYLQDILESGRHLLSLINDILDLSKIEAGRMELELAEFDLPTAIDNALMLVRERASRRGIRLGSAIDERLGMIGGDERKVKQVLLNLLSNALKFTPEGGRIDVGARLIDQVVEVSVADTGIGIAPEDQDAVFEEFRQVGTADKKAEGTGLGLALSRKFIELHGGRIWVKSQVGQGSTFTFTLPVLRED